MNVFGVLKWFIFKDNFLYQIFIVKGGRVKIILN